MSDCKVIGVYEVPTEEPCHLVEVLLTGLHGPLDVGAFTQPVRDLDQADWQVPYQEALLDHDGERILAGQWLTDADASHWLGSVRLVFFFHFLDVAHDLHSPLGPLSLPAPSTRPHRLDRLAYEPPG